MKTDLLLLFFAGRTKKRRAFNSIKLYKAVFLIIATSLILLNDSDFVCFF